MVLALWAVAAVVAWRVGSRALQWLHVVVGAALVLGAVSMARIFGKPWYYLTLWAWGITAVMLGAIAWSGVALVRHLRAPGRARRPDSAVGRRGVGRRCSAERWRWCRWRRRCRSPMPRCPRLASATRCGRWPAPTEAAVVAGVGAADGPDPPYQVRWSDAADIGSPGFGLLAALERDGLDVAADPYFHVPVTDHRTRRTRRVDRPDPAGDRQLRRRAGARCPAPSRWPRTTRAPSPSGSSSPPPVAGCSSRLASEGLDDVVPLVDTNLFGAALDPRLSAADQADFTTLLDLGQPMAVFIAPVDAEPAPPT